MFGPYSMVRTTRVLIILAMTPMSFLQSTVIAGHVETTILLAFPSPSVMNESLAKWRFPYLIMIFELEYRYRPPIIPGGVLK